MEWQELTIEINYEAGEAVAGLLEDAGAQGVIMEEIDNRQRVIAYFQEEQMEKIKNNTLPRIKTLAKYGLDTGKVIVEIKTRDDEDWSTSWQKFFHPVEAGHRFLITPSWEQVLETDRKVIKIDPGMAFGVGSHETTRICIDLLEKYINNSTIKMLDIGTGTGILSIVAAMLGVKEILAIDIDPAAVKSARENIIINKVSEQIQVKAGDLTVGVSVAYPFITANLLPDIILRLLPSIPPLLTEGGLIVLSGIIREKTDLIIKELAGYNLEVIDNTIMGEWVGLVARKDR